MTYLAVPISGRNIKEATEQIGKACALGAEMLELRTDFIENLTVDCFEQLLVLARNTSLPVIVTCRDKAEGGCGEYPLDFRIDILCRAIAAGADFVDCEFVNFQDDSVENRLLEALEDSQTRLILSAHNFDQPFGDLAALYENIIDVCPQAIPKLVYKANHINDCFAAFDLLKNKTGDAIVLCMSAAGMISRVLAKKFGSLVTFASLSDEASTAPGQVGIEQMKSLYRWDHIDAETRIYGVIGNPVGHSLSPAIFNACFDKQKLNALYLPILLEGQKLQFNEFMSNLLKNNYDFGGFSVTIPHKAHALDYAEVEGDHLESLAADIGAVNTLKVGFGGQVSGYNTDYAGALNALLSTLGITKHQLHSVSTAVLGAGGVGRAIVAGLTDIGAHVTIYNRTVAKAKSLAEEFSCKYASLEEATNMDAKIVNNCTSIGMPPNVDNSPLPKECINCNMAVFDTVYNPLETLILKYAKETCAKTINGAEMFIRQAMAQYKIFTGNEPDEEVMRTTVFGALKR